MHYRDRSNNNWIFIKKKLKIFGTPVLAIVSIIISMHIHTLLPDGNRALLQDKSRVIEVLQHEVDIVRSEVTL